MGTGPGARPAVLRRRGRVVERSVRLVPRRRDGSRGRLVRQRRLLRDSRRTAGAGPTPHDRRRPAGRRQRRPDGRRQPPVLAAALWRRSVAHRPHPAARPRAGHHRRHRAGAVPRSEHRQVVRRRRADRPGGPAASGRAAERARWTLALVARRAVPVAGRPDDRRGDRGATQRAAGRARRHDPATVGRGGPGVLPDRSVRARAGVDRPIRAAETVPPAAARVDGDGWRGAARGLRQRRQPAARARRGPTPRAVGAARSGRLAGSSRAPAPDRKRAPRDPGHGARSRARRLGLADAREPVGHFGVQRHPGAPRGLAPARLPGRARPVDRPGLRPRAGVARPPRQRDHVGRADAARCPARS